MPRKAIDYSNTIIYKIQHEDNSELIYVGHTTDFTKRKYQHKHFSTCLTNSKHNLKVYKMIRDNGGWECFRMIEIKKFSCNDSNEACAEEDRIMQELKPIMNSQRAYTGLTTQEYNKQYNIDNVDVIKEQQKQYNINNVDKLSEIHKNYRINNNEKIKVYRRQYHIDNGDKIREKNKEKMTCECGAIICKGSLSRHTRTKTHLDLMMLK